MIPVIGLGAGGHARVVVEILRFGTEYDIKGLLDSDTALWQTTVLGVPVLGNDELLPRLYDQGIRHAFVGVGATGNVTLRKRLYETARRQGLSVVTAIHPQSIVSPSTRLGDGATVMAGAILNAGVQAGANVIVNTGAIVDHDCVLQDHVHVAPGARLAGNVTVEAESHIGLGASVVQGICIGKHSIVGAGAVVIRDVSDYAIVVGVPARVLRRIELDS
ncbi:MAG: acetyltransferase [Planctomycetota bacterium]|jgi:UDP-perosamine 4-acetyltransferase